MAAGTRCLLVCTCQRKPGLARVIKFDLRPALGTVTGIALLAVASLMYVITGVAAAAGGRCLLLYNTVAVTGSARNLPMLVKQGKPGGVVVEYSLFPAIHAVAGIALLAILSGMNVRSLVACNASCLRKFIDLPGVTAAAGDFAV